MNFLGFANYYREFIKLYADKIYPMQQMMRNNGKKFTWTDKAQVSFENINANFARDRSLECKQRRGCLY